jgi:hypothetical protein
MLLEPHATTVAIPAEELATLSDGTTVLLSDDPLINLEKAER